MPEPDASGCTTKQNGSRLVVVADNGLWVGTATLDDDKNNLISVTIERFDLKVERLRVSLNRNYSGTASSQVWFRLDPGEELIFADDDSALALTHALG